MVALAELGKPQNESRISDTTVRWAEREEGISFHAGDLEGCDRRRWRARIDTTGASMNASEHVQYTWTGLPQLVCGQRDCLRRDMWESCFQRQAKIAARVRINTAILEAEHELEGERDLPHEHCSHNAGSINSVSDWYHTTSHSQRLDTLLLVTSTILR